MVKIGTIFIFKISKILFQHGINMQKHKMGVQRGAAEGSYILALSLKNTGEDLPHTHTLIINPPQIHSFWTCPQFPVETLCNEESFEYRLEQTEGS